MDMWVYGPLEAWTIGHVELWKNGHVGIDVDVWACRKGYLLVGMCTCDLWTCASVGLQMCGQYMLLTCGHVNLRRFGC